MKTLNHYARMSKESSLERGRSDIFMFKCRHLNRRRFFLIIIIVLINTPLFGQKKSIYEKAFRYIVDRNAGKNIIVVDTTINLSFHNFSEEISELWGKDNNSTFSLLDSIDHTRENKKSVSIGLKNLKISGKGPTHIVYFSSPYSFMIIGEILLQKSKKHGLNHNAQTGFNESTQYLFVFDKKYSLKQVFKQTIAYD